jgi:hypothetical protein
MNEVKRKTTIFLTVQPYVCVWVSVERVQEGEKDILALEIFDNDFVVRRREMKTKI